MDDNAVLVIFGAWKLIVHSTVRGGYEQVVVSIYSAANMAYQIYISL